MKSTWNVSGMKCHSCVAKITAAVSEIDGVDQVQVDLPKGVLTADISETTDPEMIEQAVRHAGSFDIVQSTADSAAVSPSTMPANAAPSAETYFPLMLIVGFILGGCALLQVRAGSFEPQALMPDFMGLFFVVFAFFKLLNLQGFADAYGTYDIIAARARSWGLVYPFVELALGVAYLVRFQPPVTNAITLVLMLIGTVGVVQTLLARRQIQCACLGTVFNLPMSTVTLIEDGGMAAMAAMGLVM